MIFSIMSYLFVKIYFAFATINTFLKCFLGCNCWGNKQDFSLLAKAQREATIVGNFRKGLFKCILFCDPCIFINISHHSNVAKGTESYK